MNDIKVSIVCITYNHENYISKALDSFLMQKVNFKYEILIHDDASTDSTAQIIRGYEEKYPEIIKPVYQTQNQHSLGNPIFTGILLPKAQGEYVAFCEGDDFWTDENKLQRQVNFLDANREYTACVHRYITVDEENNQTDIKTFGYYENEGVYKLKDFETNQLPSQLASLVCRNMFFKEGVGYPESFHKNKVQGDVKYFLYLLAHGDIYRMKESSSAYRCICKTGSGSWSSRQIGNCEAHYKRFKALKQLEKDFYNEYGQKISLKERKIRGAGNVVKSFVYSPSFKSAFIVLKVIFSQPGVISYCIKSRHKK